jgi:type VI secretion system protein ImpC
LACALATRIEPHLLRELRLNLLPGTGVSAEAELWFSSLVSDRTSTGVVLNAELREALLPLLNLAPGWRDLAWHITEFMHHESPPALRMEEELAYYWLIGKHTKAQDCLRSLVATLVSPDRPGAWRWAAQAVVRLPRELMAIEEAQMLAMGTALRAGDSATLMPLRPETGGGWHWLNPHAQQLDMALTLREGAIEFKPAARGSESALRVPDAHAVLIEILRAGTGERVADVKLNPRQRTLVPVDGEAFDLRVIGGSRATLRRVHAEARGARGKSTARPRVPRVQIEYELEIYGASKQVQLPFIIGVLADLRGVRDAHTPPLAERELLDIDVDTFDECMRRLRPRVSFAVPNVLRTDGEPGSKGSELRVDLTFDSIDAFRPDAVLQALPEAAVLMAERRTAFESRTKSGNPKERLAAWDAQLAGFDRVLSRQADWILHHPDFQRLEGTWRGLHHLVNRTESSERLKIQVLDASQDELLVSFQARAGEDWLRWPLYGTLHEKIFGTFGGEPLGCLLADYGFGPSPAQIELLGELGRLCAQLPAPLIAAAEPRLFGLSSWQQLKEGADPERLMETAARAPWRALRNAEHARFVVLTAPRFLSRVPYGEQTTEVQGFSCQESARDIADFTWSNSAYAMGANIARAFAEASWPARIRGLESGGVVDGLPTRNVQGSAGEPPRRLATEVAFSDRQERVLSQAGLCALADGQRLSSPVFFSAHALMRVAEPNDPAATIEARMQIQLPQLLAACRFAHYLKCIARDRIGSWASSAAIERWMNDWLMNYVDGDPYRSPESAKAMRPLASAEFHVEAPMQQVSAAAESAPWLAQLSLAPHYQLDGPRTPIALSVRLPGLDAAMPQGG